MALNVFPTATCNGFMRGTFFLCGIFIWAAPSASSLADPQSSAMVLVRGGTLPQGSELAGRVVKDFEIGKYEVTWGEWKAVRDWAVSKGYDLEGVGSAIGQNYPITNISWFDAVKWCNARSEKEGKTAVYQVDGSTYRRGFVSRDEMPLVSMHEESDGYRLPYETEWEWAASGGVASKGFKYCGSNQVKAAGWVYSNSADGAKAVGQKLGNELGLHDMSGNVWEWCWDSSTYVKRRVRGGSWLSLDEHAQLLNRASTPEADYLGPAIGFRIVCSPNSKPRLGVTSGKKASESIVVPVMVPVRGGRLPRGSELAGQVVKDFEIGKYEVTWGEWKAVRDWAVKRGYDLYEVGQGSGDNHPVRNVNWYEAVKWCNARSEKEGKTAVYEENGVVYRSGDFGSKGSAAVKMRSEADGYRLPLEAEWEWAARGGAYSKGYDYSGGNDLNEVGWHWKNSSGAVVGLGIDGTGTWPVGKKNGNELGLHDMSGNVYEWCWDLVQETAHRRERGGSFSLHSGFCRLGSRESDAPNYGIGINGFRIVRITAHGVEASVTTGVDLQNATAKLSVSPQQGVMVSVKGGTLPQVSELAGQVVGDFSIGKTEVTWGEWKAVREWAATKGYDLAKVGGTNPKQGGDSLPVVEVSWYDVVKWCNARSEKEGKTAVYEANGGVYRSGEFGAKGSTAVTMKSGANGYRLPLEAEWEWAARGGVSSKGYTYSGSNVVGEVAWIGAKSPKGTKAVGGKKANELGLYDMSGNVFEWVWELSDGSSNRRFRGGGCYDFAYYAEVSSRDAYDYPDLRSCRDGFRVAFSSVP